MMIKLSKKLIGEIVSWQTERDRNQGESWTEEEVVENSDDIQELLEMTKQYSRHNQAVELHLYTEEGKWIGLVQHISADGVENINGGEEYLSSDEVAKIVNKRISC